MLYLNLSGRGPHKVCEDVVFWFVSKYLPRHKLTINVNHRGLKREHVDGWCWVEDCNWNPREFMIEIQTGLPRDHYIQTLLHELQHVLQHVRGDLRDKRGIRCWKGTNCSDVNYEDQPWEIEARQMEEVLWTQYLTEVSKT
jgi:hypothetical protein